MPATAEAELVLDAQCDLGEGPVWDASASCLYFVDILRGDVHRFDPITSATQTYRVDQPVGAAALTRRGDLVLAVRDGFARLDSATGAFRAIAAVEADRPDCRMNDGKCDAAGRFWAGTMALDERPGAGSLYRLDPDGTVHTILRAVGISNGLDWTADGRQMYYVDSLTQAIDLFDVDPSRGTISNRRVFVRIPTGQGAPDGLTLDADGYVWVALWGGAAVHRYAPDGSLDTVVQVPVTYPTSCAFGGPELRDLYITTARITLSAHQRAAQPSAGGLFRCRPGARGRAPHRFAG
jgi:sugar lactone lactonase YvrE